MMTNLAPITQLWREWVFLRPEHGVAIEHEGIVYPSLRHALEATKTPDIEERKSLLDKHGLAVAVWGIDKPREGSYKTEWIGKIHDTTLVLAAQKYGLLGVDHDLRQRLQLAMWLTLTAGRPIVYNNTQCDVYWGKCFCSDHGKTMFHASGLNILGTATQTIRAKIIKEMEGSDPLFSNHCDWCRMHRRNRTTPASWYILYLQGGDLVRRAMCDKHIVAEKQEARRHADSEWHLYPISEYPADFKLPSLTTPSDRPKTWMQPASSITWEHARRESSPIAPPAKDTWGSWSIIKGRVINHAIRGVA